MKIKGLIILLFSFVLVECSDTEINIPNELVKSEPVIFNQPENLISYVDESRNGYIKTKQIEQISYTAFLKPIDYLLAKETEKRKSDRSLKREDFEDLQYFDLRITITDFKHEFIKYNLLTAQQYKERVNYCAFEMQEDISLIDGKDTLDCLLFHFERAFDIVPYGHFILGFRPNNASTVNKKTLIYRDNLFGNGDIKFTFSPAALVNEPILAMN